MNSMDGVGSGQVAPVTSSPMPVERLQENRELIRAVKAVNAAEYFDQNSELTFKLDKGRPIVRLIDKNTKEVIRQIPPEYVLRLSDDLKSPTRMDG
jgi:flagellar protein FlaG